MTTGAGGGTGLLSARAVLALAHQSSTAYESAGGATGGFEEWRARDGVIPEPSAALIFAAGLLAVRRARR